MMSLEKNHIIDDDVSCLAMDENPTEDLGFRWVIFSWDSRIDDPMQQEN